VDLDACLVELDHLVPALSRWAATLRPDLVVLDAEAIQDMARGGPAAAAGLAAHLASPLLLMPRTVPPRTGRFLAAVPADGLGRAESRRLTRWTRILHHAWSSAGARACPCELELVLLDEPSSEDRIERRFVEGPADLLIVGDATLRRAGTGPGGAGPFDRLLDGHGPPVLVLPQLAQSAVALAAE
jgi:hypothetical protein